MAIGKATTLLALLAAACTLDSSGGLTAPGPDASAGTGGSVATDAAWGDAPGSGGSAGAAASDSGAAGSGGLPVTQEGSCTDGNDGDGDGAIDCADDECMPTHRCAPELPGGWSGPVVLALGATPAPGCEASGGYPTQHYDLPQQDHPPAQCAACTCDAAPVTCAPPKVTSYDHGNCSSTKLSLTLTATCTEFDDSGPDQNGTKLEVGSPSGKCTAGGGTAVLPTPTVASHARICGDAEAGSGCGSDYCVPRPAAPYAEVCIVRSGSHGCPSEYPVPHSLAESYDDQRGCSECACDNPSCTANVTVFENDDCTGVTLTSLSQHGQCGGFLLGQGSMGVRLDQAGVSCKASGGEPTGSVIPQLVTVCCLPP